LNKKYHKFSSAFTLVEVLLVVGMVAVVALAVTGIVYSSYQDWQVISRRSNVLQDGRAAIDFMVRTLRQAKDFTAISAPSEPAGFITFTSVDDITEEFRLNTGTDELEYGESGSLSALTGPVNSLTFTYYDLDGNALDETEVGDIRSIVIQAEFADAEDPSLTFTLSGRVFVPTDEATPPCLLAWWKLDDGFGLTAIDSSGNGYDGSLENMDGTEWTAGVRNGALQFDGNQDFVDCGNPSGLQITGVEVSVACWFYADSLNQSDWPSLCGKSSNDNWDDGWGAFFYDDAARFYVNRWNRNVAYMAFTDTGSWHHFAGTYDGSTVKVYIDGVKGTDDNYSGTIDDSGDFTIAEMGDWATGRWHGKIDDVRIYGCTLSDEEVAELADILRYRQFTEAKAASDTTSITIGTPGGTSEGDLLIAAVATDGDTSLSLAPPGGEGWTQIDIDDYSNQVTLGAWWKNAGASESPTHEFTWTGDEQAYGWMMRFTGHDSSDPVNFWAANSESSVTPNSPAVVTTIDNCLILRLGAFDDSDITVDDPGLSGHTAITMDSSSGGGAAYEEFTEQKVLTAGTSITIDTPAGTSEDDLLIAAVATEGDTSGSLAPPGGEGWTEIDIGQRGTKVTLGVWWKLADASESSTHEFTWSGSKKAYGWIMRFTGHDTSSAINATANGGGKSKTPQSPAVTTTVANAMILRIGGFAGKDITVDAPGLSGHTAITMDQSDKCSGGAGYVTQSATGSSGTSNFTLKKPKEYRAVTIAIAPGAGSGGIVSGGAGYVSQATAGDSGTSTFSLTASQEARTLTIAIAPAP